MLGPEEKVGWPMADGAPIILNHRTRSHIDIQQYTIWNMFGWSNP